MKQVKDLIYDDLFIKLDEKRQLAQIFLYDQFSEEFDDLIQKYTTTSSICGFTAIANAMILSDLIPTIGIRETLIQLKGNRDLRRKYIEHAMNHIQNSRKGYIQRNEILKQKQREATNYMKDWVANYEISDYLRCFKKENVYFIRNVAWDHPEALKDIQYEEKERINEEKQFKGQEYFIDYGKDGKFINKTEYKYNRKDVYIVDILGHFISSIVIEDGDKECILILETMRNNRLLNETLKNFYQY